SRNPPAETGRRSSGVIPARHAATAWGRWLTIATAASWAAGVIVTTRQPRAAQKSAAVSIASGSLWYVGVRMAARPADRSGREKGGPFFSAPAIGGPPTNRGAADPTAATIPSFVLPASAMTARGFARAASITCPAIAFTGVVTGTIVDSRTA